MPRNPPEPSRRSLCLWGLANLLVLVIGGLVWKFKLPPQAPAPSSQAPAVPIQNPAVVEYRATGTTTGQGAGQGIALSPLLAEG